MFDALKYALYCVFVDNALVHICNKEISKYYLVIRIFVEFLLLMYSNEE